MATSVPITQNVVTVTDNGSTVDVGISTTAVSVSVGTTGPQGATGPGVPTGGTTGQALVKTSAADYATGWAAPAPAAHASTHADGGSDEITVSQDQVTGLTSALAGKAASASPIQPFAWSGGYLSGLHRDTVTVTVGNGVLYLVPIRLSKAITLDRLSVEVLTTPGGTGSVVRLGIYNHNTTTDLPDTLLVDAGTVDTTTTGTKEATISQTLAAGTVYWLAAVAQGSPSPNPTLRAFVPISMMAIPGASANGCRYCTGVTGALPNPVGALAPPDQGNPIRILGRIA